MRRVKKAYSKVECVNGIRVAGMMESVEVTRQAWAMASIFDEFPDREVFEALLESLMKNKNPIVDEVGITLKGR